MTNRREFLTAVGAGAASWTALADARGGAAEITDLSAALASLRDKHQVPALGAALVKRDSGLVALGAAGVRKEGDSTPVTPKDRFHLGSCTKAMTAALVAQLVDAGKLKWETPLASALPSYAKRMDGDWKKVTVEQVLWQRAGFPEKTEPKGKTLRDVHRFKGDAAAQRREYCALILKQDPANPPGRKFAYSNAGYTVAGAIVEDALKTSWEEALKSRIGAPLGMTTLGFGPPGAADKVTDPWPHLGAKGDRKPLPPGPQADNPAAIGPAGRAHCSLADWGKFLQALLGAPVANGKPLLSEESRRKLFTAPEGREYGMGWIPADEAGFGKGTWMHAGSNTLNYCEAWINPERGFALLAATNCGDGRDATQEACVEMAKRFKLLG